MTDDISVEDIRGVGPVTRERLAQAGIESAEDVAEADPADIEAIEGVGTRTILRLYEGEPERRL
jgi:predicted flap endonuclease-1-like 5' DNA nuclease